MSSKPTSNSKKIWERWDDEGIEAFEAFELYLKMGSGRSISKVVVECKKSVSLISRWSAKFKWQDRLKAYYDEETRRKNEARLKEVERAEKEKTRRQIVEDMNERHARQAIAFSSVISKLEAEFGQRVTNGNAQNELAKIPMEKLLDDIIRGASVQPKLHEAERTARGVHPTQNLNVAAVDVTKLDNEELARLAGRVQW